MVFSTNLLFHFILFYSHTHREIQDRTVLKIYEPGYIEDPNIPPRSCNSTPIDLNYYSEPELELDYQDTRRGRFHTMSGGIMTSPVTPVAGGQEEVVPRPQSATPLEMGHRPQQPVSLLASQTIVIERRFGATFFPLSLNLSAICW